MKPVTSLLYTPPVQTEMWNHVGMANILSHAHMASNPSISIYIAPIQDYTIRFKCLKKDKFLK